MLSCRDAGVSNDRQKDNTRSDADCKTEWTKADLNKDNVLTDTEAAPYLAKMKSSGKNLPADGKLTPAIFEDACKAGAFTTTAAATTNMNATTNRDDGAPLIGSNSFTESQAKDRVTAAGLTGVSTLAKDADGIWRGTASKDGHSTSVAVDFKGNVVSE